MEICSGISLHWADISEGTVTFQIFSEWKWISQLTKNQEDGRNEAHFPWCIFLSANKKMSDLRKAVWLCVFFLSLCVAAFENCQCFVSFSVIMSGGADGPSGILIMYYEKYIFYQLLHPYYHYEKEYSSYLLSVFTCALSRLLGK